MYFLIQLKMATLYYRKHKETIQKEAHEKCQNHSEEGKDKRQKKKRLEKDIKISPKKKEEKKRQYYREPNQNLSEKQKQK